MREINEMIRSMRYEASIEFGKFAETISEWFAPIIRMWRFTKNNGITEGFHRKMKFAPIIRMWRFTKNNGITEGFHRKMKLIQRRAYGYRNFENYRLRVLVECGVNL